MAFHMMFVENIIVPTSKVRMIFFLIPALQRYSRSAAVSHALRMRINLASDELKRNIMNNLRKTF